MYKKFVKAAISSAIYLLAYCVALESLPGFMMVSFGKEQVMQGSVLYIRYGIMRKIFFAEGA